MNASSERFRPHTEAGEAGLAAVLADPGGTLLASDFDGVLAPIVDDPEAAYAHAGVLEALGRLGGVVGKVAIVTGRPVRGALRLGGFEGAPGLGELSILGQYGVERWDAATGEITEPPPPAAIAEVDDAVPGLLAELGLTDVRVEHKGRAVGLHTRTLDDPRDAFERLREPVTELGDRLGLTVEPGKNVWELRPEGTDKGETVRALAAEAGARQVVYVGDDLGDVPAFEAVRSMRGDGTPGLLVYSRSTEEDALADLADLEVDGSDEVAAWLTWLADQVRR